jgi:hypothetical protein
MRGSDIAATGVHSRVLSEKASTEESARAELSSVSAPP